MGKLIQSSISLYLLVFTLTASSDKSLNAQISSHNDHTIPTTQTRKIRPDGTCNENTSPFNCPAIMYPAGKAGVPGPIGPTGPQGMTGPTGATGETGEGLSCLVDTTITTSGVYFLCNDVDTVSIQSSNVTLDLNGYRIFNGVTLSNGISNVIVKNGQIGPDTTINIAANAITNISTDGILTGSCTDCIFQDLVIEHCANGIHMVATDSTMISNNKIINCICNSNSSNGIFLDNMSGNAIQECTCSYNLTGSYSDNNVTVSVTTTVEGSGIRLDQSHNNTIEGCICSYNVTDCFCRNHGIDGTGLPGVQNALLKGGGIYMTTSEYNSITNCRCEHNNGDNLCSNTGGNGGTYRGGGAGVGGGGGGEYGTGGSGTCYIQGGGVYIDTTCEHNTVTGCTCSGNNSGNLAFNTGGNGTNYGSGAGVGGGGGGTLGAGGSGTCYTQGGGVYIDTTCDNNTVTGCTCSGNNSGNLAFNTGGNDSNYGGGGAGIGGGGGAGGYLGGTGICYTQGGGVYINTTCNNNTVSCCTCSDNNTCNLASNIGGNGGYYSSGGAGVGGGGRGEITAGGTGTCYTQGGGVYINTTCDNNTVSGCTCSDNNSGNLAFNTGGNASNYGGGGAGVGGGGSRSDVGGSGSCYTQGGGVCINTTCNNNTVSCCTCSDNNTGNLASNTGGNGGDNGGGGAGVGGGGGGRDYRNVGGSGTCYTKGGGVYIDTTCDNNTVSGCTYFDNNTGNLASNTGGNGGDNGGGGAGVGGGGGEYGAGGPGTCYTEGGGINLDTGCDNNAITGCTCSDNNTDNLASNTGGNGGANGGGGAGVGGGGGGIGSEGDGGLGTCYTEGGGMYIDTDSNRNDINSCECTTNNTDNLYTNTGGTGLNPGEQVGDGGAGTGGTGGIGTCYTDGAGIFLGNASCNVINGCDMVANYTCGIQLGSPFDAGDNTLAENLVMDCSVKGSLDCVQSTSLDGIVSYATTGTNVFENNVARYCNRGFVQTAAAVDTFLRNTAYKNGTQYTNISNVVAFTNPPVTAADNITIP